MSGLGAAVGAALGPLLSVAAALGTVKKGLDVAFERGAAEQKLRNFTDSTGEFEAAMGAAAQASSRFGISQTEATGALAETYGRLKGLGFGLKETTEIYTGFNAIAQQSGVTAEDASGAFLQLSQALGSGKLQGDELRAILERMPQLAQAIAQSMGVSAGEIRRMGQEGKITSEVIYKALSGAAEGADQLGTKLNEQQQAMKALGQVSDQLLNTIGQVFAPVVISGAEALAKAGQVLADWWDYIGGVVFPQVYQAIKPVINELQFAFRDLDLEPFRVFLQNVLIKGFQVVTGVVGNFAKVLGFVINAMRALAQNPVFKFIAEQVGRLLHHLGLTTDKVGEFNQKQDEAKQAAAETVKQYSNLPPVVDNAKEAQKEFKAEVDKSKAAYALLADEIDRAAQKQDLMASRAAAVNSYKQALLGLEQQQLDYAYDNAKTAEQRLDIAVKQFQLTARMATLEFEAQKAANAEAVRAAELQIRKNQLKYEEVRAERALAAARGQETAPYDAALRAQQDVINFSKDQLQITKEIEVINNGVAAAQFQQKIISAQIALSTKLQSTEIGIAKQRADEMAVSYGAAAVAATNAANAIAAANRAAAGGKANTPMPTGSMSISAGGKTINRQFYADGGYVTRPTNAVIGEGGEPEYVIPSSKMAQAMANYSVGARGNAVLGGGGGTPQVNVTYSGSTVTLDGQSYISRRDIPGLLSSAVNQTIATLGGSPSARKRAGVI